MILYLGKKPKGFTLAEVLITLGIIGVVAALTIPNMIKNSQKIEYVVAMKKSYTTFQNGMKAYMANQGCNDLQCTGLFMGAESTNANKIVEFTKIFSGLKTQGQSIQR